MPSEPSEPIDIKESWRNFIKPKLEWFTNKNKPQTGMSGWDRLQLFNIFAF